MIEKHIQEHHDYLAETVAQEPIMEDPIVRTAWLHGLVGTEAVNRYLRTLSTPQVIGSRLVEEAINES